MESFDRDDLGSVPILVSEEGFPGELSSADAARARELLRSSQAQAVLVAAGAGVFWRVDPTAERVVRPVGTGTQSRDDGFALGTGDGATIPGLPLDWDLLTFRCPYGDTTVLLAHHPADLPKCPTHAVPLEFQESRR